MRRKDREISDFNSIVSFVESCDTIRLGINADGYPYVVPLSFGFSAYDGKITFYFHCAKTGKKVDLISRNNKVCVEADVNHGFVMTTADYQSFIGFGTVIKCEGEEKIKGLDLLMKHCGYDGFHTEECRELDVTDVYRIDLDEFTCKKMNL